MWAAALRASDVTGPLEQWRKSLAGKAAMIDREGLVAHYDFDGSLSDSSGGYQNGRTLKGDPTFGAGRVNRSVSFDSQTLVTLGSRTGVARATASLSRLPSGFSLPAANRTCRSCRKSIPGHAPGMGDLAYRLRAGGNTKVGRPHRHSPDVALARQRSGTPHPRTLCAGRRGSHVAVVSDGTGKAQGRPYM